MQGKFTIRIKAALLLIVFSLNSVLGFACSIGVDLGYNQHHHSEAKEHSHVIVSDHSHNAGGHSHDHASEVEREHETKKAPATTDDCCKDGVVKFTLLDKSVSSTVKIDAPTHLALNVVATYFLEVWNAQHVSTSHYYVRSDHPPISHDIRIAIRSFQI